MGYRIITFVIYLSLITVISAKILYQYKATNHATIACLHAVHVDNYKKFVTSCPSLTRENFLSLSRILNDIVQELPQGYDSFIRLTNAYKNPIKTPISSEEYTLISCVHSLPPLHSITCIGAPDALHASYLCLNTKAFFALLNNEPEAENFYRLIQARKEKSADYILQDICSAAIKNFPPYTLQNTHPSVVRTLGRISLMLKTTTPEDNAIILAWWQGLDKETQQHIISLFDPLLSTRASPLYLCDTLQEGCKYNDLTYVLSTIFMNLFHIMHVYKASPIYDINMRLNMKNAFDTVRAHPRCFDHLSDMKITPSGYVQFFFTKKNSYPKAYIKKEQIGTL